MGKWEMAKFILKINWFEMGNDRIYPEDKSARNVEMANVRIYPEDKLA